MAAELCEKRIAFHFRGGHQRFKGYSPHTQGLFVKPIALRAGKFDWAIALGSITENKKEDDNLKNYLGL